jgi:MFS family permease
MQTDTDNNVDDTVTLNVNDDNDQESLSPAAATTTKPTPIPKGSLLAVMTVIISEGFAFTFLFPFVGFMVLDFGLVTDERDAGYYAGLLAGVYSVAQFFSGFIFGVLADRLPKRVIVFTSTFGGMIAILLFGLSPNYYWALTLRAMNGALNGNMATAKAYLAEITDASNQSMAFSFIGVAWGIGAIGGPAIGGFLSNPATKYPAIFGGLKIFNKHPYLLPCLFTACVNIIAIICTVTFMKPPSNSQTTVASTATTVDSSSNNTVDDSDTQEQQNKQHSIELNETTDIEMNSTPIEENQVTLETQEEQLDQFIPLPPQKPLHTRIVNRIIFELKELISLYKNMDVTVCTGLYFAISFIDTFQEELFPLWSLIGTKHGGLSFKTSQIGIVQMVVGCLMVFEPLLYPRITKMIGKLGACRVGFCIYACLVFTPLLSLLANVSQVALGFGLAIYTLVRASTEMLAFTSIFIMLNNSSPPGAAGRVQSLSHSVGCISRALAPFLAGPVLAFCAHMADSVSMLFIHAPFFIITITCTLALITTMKLSKSINEPKVSANKC